MEIKLWGAACSYGVCSSSLMAATAPELWPMRTVLASHLHCFCKNGSQIFSRAMTASKQFVRNVPGKSVVVGFDLPRCGSGKLRRITSLNQPVFWNSLAAHAYPGFKQAGGQPRPSSVL